MLNNYSGFLSIIEGTTKLLSVVMKSAVDSNICCSVEHSVFVIHHER